MRSYSPAKSIFFTRRKLLQALPAVVPLGLSPSHGGSKETLFLYNWDDYIGTTTLTDFTTQTGSPVQMDLFADIEELFAKLRLGKSGYDVTIPTHNFVERMWLNQLLLPLDHAKIPNLGNLATQHQNPAYDPHNQHSVPYMWGYMGLAYRKSAVAKPTSWRDVFTAQGLQANGRVAWLSEVSSLYSATALMLGYSANNYNPATQDKVFSELREAKPYLTTIAPDNGQDLLAARDVDIAIEWNGDIAVLIEEDPDIGFVIPAEGSIYFVDCMCIPSDAPHPDLAHKFIDFILDPIIGKNLAQDIGYGTPNTAALALTDTTYRTNLVTFPTDISKLEVPTYPGEQSLRLLYANWETFLGI